ncbi:hypothetical protein GQ55_3G450800 [Panicum hallii var. hallii]|uniref:BED-type domain-containing protein n=1 Tax=Panicum hallii var. hallii TaxID=1504633 RepID=A0A2T7EIH5_9POAL|nr:hypothetical protein GQ55_3G450800 [Panicum hallii var. hallii]
MEPDGAAATLRNINDAMEEVRRRSLRDRGWTIEKALEDMRSGMWEWRRKASRRLQANAGLAEVDPWDLPRRFAMPKDQRTSSLRTYSGYWKEKEDEFIAIRKGGGEGSSSPSSSPCYEGVRRTLEFYELNNGTKTDWVMHEYYHLDNNKFLQEDVVLRKVFNKKHTDRIHSCSESLDSVMKAYHEALGKHGAQEVLSIFDEKKSLLHEVMQSVRELVKMELDFAKINVFYEVIMPSLREGFEEAESGCGEFPTASAAPDGESDDVWQHFTRINTKDPDVVYAACHRCDRVLRAHSKNGTSHLRRHRKTKTCTCNNNPSSTTEDQESLRELRANLDLYKQGKMEGRVVDSPDLNASVDPWDLPTPRYFTSSLNRKTHQGRWEEIKSNDKLIAIRIGQLPMPQYAGLKRALEFHHDDGTKTDWIMLEYHQVDEYNTHDLLLEGSMVFRKVIQIFKDAVKELERMWNGDDEEEERYIGEREEEVKACMSTLLRDCLLGEVGQSDQSRVGKRKRTGAPEGGSEVWLYFTKIYTMDPDRVYAVCHSCDRVYKGHPKNGTSHLKRHTTRHAQASTGKCRGRSLAIRTTFRKI